MNGSENNSTAMQNTIENSFEKGHMYAKVTSRPGQTWKCDDIILEGNDLVLLMQKLERYKVDESSTWLDFFRNRAHFVILSWKNFVFLSSDHK